MWHPRPELWALHLWPLDGSSQTSLRAFKTQSLRLEPRLDASMPLNGLFSPPGAQTSGTDPVSCDISLILSFLQELLDKGHSPSTLKVYVADIAASHALIAGQLVGRDNLVVCFLKGSRRLNPPHPSQSLLGICPLF